MRGEGHVGVLDERARATRRKILVEATKLFARQGYHATTVADLAKAIGMTQGALFHHFPNKEALLHTVIARLARGVDEYRALMEGASPEEAVRGVVERMCEHFRRQPEAAVCLSALATEFAGTDHPILAEIEAAYERFVEPFAAVLAQVPTVANPRAGAIAFIGAVQGIGIQGLLRGGEPPLEEMASGFLGLFGVARE
ncbi:MAG: TetR/AcrR family transcriptional regulator [Deltaproteobacteria bacterium]|nr:TetR/AcrR family transcriptional regulator [Deltaproteobacteria bacterium]